MVGTSKILTVSYGTFSCTLEGFDDSFNTMKAIAEYFRGLAADDRYFGAEPPTPDAEMLAQIAEREISRRVDAHMDDDGIHLRAAALTDQSDSADDVAPQHDEASRAEVETARKAAKAARKAEKKAARKAAKAEAKAAKEAEAEARAEAEAQAEAEAEREAQETAEAEAEAEEAKHAEEDVTPDDASFDTSILDSVSAATADASDGSHGSDVEETRDDAPSSMLAASDPAPENTRVEDDADTIVPAHPDADSVAAKLQRIRAVVGKTDDAPSDDLTEQFLPQADAQDVADVATDEPEAGGTDIMSRVLSRHPDQVQVLDDTSSDDAETGEAEAEADAEPVQPRARVVRMKRADFEKAIAENEAKAEPEVDPEPSAGPDLGLLDGADELDDYLEDSDFVESDLDLGDDAGLDAGLANDLKAIRDDLSHEDDAPQEPVQLSDTLSDVLADQDGGEDDVVAEDVDDEDEQPANAFLADEPQVDDEALDRLMSESDAQMQEPEGSRRRDAIEQLKAAVAAKEAARKAGDTDDDDQDVENAFRNDLSEVVSPEGAAPRPRPVVRNANTRTERPRPAPLKLVAAQRVDLPEIEPRDTPVVPRRVAARKDDAHQKAAASFAEFAENMGASELPDLLEAAAAYTSFVEGADEFSRPQILRRVRAVASDDFNREDGLRSFADLLKAGRFTKVRNGRFQVAGDSRFNPEKRAS